MKLNTKRAACLALALAFCTALAGCGSTATVESSEASSETAASSESTDVTEDAYAYIADFDFSAAFDDNGYLKGVRALDYVTLPEGYANLTLSKDAGTVSEEDISSYISEYVLSPYATTEQATDRAAENGDSVNIDYVGSVDGVEFEGGNSGGTGYTLTLGSGTFIDNFEDQIVGHTPGETFDVVVTFPENYGNEELNGKEALFKTTLNYINVTVTPELTDEWVVENLQETMGLADTASLNRFVNDSLLFQQGANAVYSQLSENAVVAEELPQAAVEYFRDYYLFNYYQVASAYGMTLDQMFSAYGFASTEDFLASYQTNFEDSARQQLIMQAVAEDQGIVCDDKALEDNFQRYFGSLDSSTYTEAYGSNYVRMSLMQDIAMQTLIDGASFS